MLCRICGVGEREHFGENFHHPFNAAGRIGHEMYRNPQWYDGIGQQTATTEEFPKPEFVTGMTVKAAVNPKFHKALEKMRAVHDKKSQDYANTASGDYYSNFTSAAQIAGITVDEVFLTLIGIKLARLRELLKSGKIPNNESLQDTRLDLANYSTLLMSYHEEG